MVKEEEELILNLLGYSEEIKQRNYLLKHIKEEKT